MQAECRLMATVLLISPSLFVATCNSFTALSWVVIANHGKPEARRRMSMGCKFYLESIRVLIC